MRTAGYFSFDDLIYAVYESNGNLSAFENPEKTDSNLSLPLLLVGDGKINNKNVTLIHEQKQDVLDFISKQNSKLKNVEVMTVDGNGKVYFKTKNQKYQILNYTLKEGVQW